jgi:hypothetical protein
MRGAVVTVLVMLTLAATIGATARSERASKAQPAPTFAPALGWWTLSTGPTDGRQLAPETWAASDEGTSLLPLFNLFVGLRKLTPSGVLIWASTSGRGGRNASFRTSTWPLRLSSFRVDRAWEGQPAANVQQRVRWSAVRGWHLDVRVYFGTEHPSRAVVAKAQAELDRLRLPQA